MKGRRLGVITSLLVFYAFWRSLLLDGGSFDAPRLGLRVMAVELAFIVSFSMPLEQVGYSSEDKSR